MVPSLRSLASIASILTLASSAVATFTASATNNIVVYWGQNSAGGATTQGRLQEYCDDNGINIINVSFLIGIKNLSVNFASASDKCTAISGTGLLSCPEIEEDIKYCQAQGKTILLSIGGATYSEGGFTDEASAVAAANTVWGLFGSPTSTANRPFGSAVVDGFDFDLESTVQNFVPFASTLRSLMDADTSKTYYLSAAPQCVYPDAALNSLLDDTISFDWINIQFYNNFCGVINFSNPNAWNFNVWDDWAKNTSKNPNVKVLIGVPANTGAGGGYVDATTLGSIIQDTKSKYSSFGGIMAWDMSQLYENSGFLSSVRSSLGSGSGNGSTTTTTTRGTTTPTPTSTTVTTSTRTTTTTTQPGQTGVPQWGQCGGIGYTGPTVCQSPYTCVSTGAWWSQCE
ncbi:putative class III chitinase [Xylaria sp. FL1777]|nr:putative class III chitinase [Xylaria sp. FL1777]